MTVRSHVIAHPASVAETARSKRLIVRSAAIATCASLLVSLATAQEIPEFGSSTANTIIVDAPPRRKSLDQETIPDQTSDGQIEEVIATGSRMTTTRWSITPAASRSGDRSSLGAELGAKHDRERNRFRLLTLSYSHVEPFGAGTSSNQARLRLRDKFLSSNKGWGLEGMAQVVRRWGSFIEPTVQLNIGFKLSDWTSLGTNVGHIWRNRDNDSTLKDFDGRFAVKQTLNRKNAFRVSADYRLKNDVTGEDDFSVGFELLDQWYFSVGKHWVASVSYVQPLKASN